MKLLFKDGQTLEIQSITAADGILQVNVIKNVYEQLKHLFTDPVTTARIEVDGTGEVYENYTVFSYIRENSGGIWIVEMQQDGKDTASKMAELEAENSALKDQIEILTGCLLEMSEEVYS
jgi:myo-inositol-hexaphosphate 3-phosphohydrolase